MVLTVQRKQDVALESLTLHEDQSPQPSSAAETTPRDVTTRRPARNTVLDARRKFLEEARGRNQANPTPAERGLATARRTPTGRAIVDEARRQGVTVTVLPDAEYDRQHPGSNGVTLNGNQVVVPARSVANPRDPSVLVHELTHAIVDNEIDLRRPPTPTSSAIGC